MEKITILGDVDSGKSTLIGKLLNNRQEDFYKSCDTFREELKYNKTITSSYYIINNIMYINSPGHIEYINDIIYSISISDKCVILIGYKNGYNQNTQLLIELCKFFKKPYIILLNIKYENYLDFSLFEKNIYRLNLYKCKKEEITKIILNSSLFKKESSEYNMIILDDSEMFYFDKDYNNIKLNFNIIKSNYIFRKIDISIKNIGIYNKNKRMIGYING